MSTCRCPERVWWLPSSGVSLWLLHGTLVRGGVPLSFRVLPVSVAMVVCLVRKREPVPVPVTDSLRFFEMSSPRRVVPVDSDYFPLRKFVRGDQWCWTFLNFVILSVTFNFHRSFCMKWHTHEYTHVYVRIGKVVQVVWRHFRQDNFITVNSGPEGCMYHTVVLKTKTKQKFYYMVNII